MEYQTQHEWCDKRPTDLVVCCSDGRYHPHIEEFVDDKLQIPESDMLIIPGGPHVLLPVSIFPKWSWASRRWIEFLAKHHPLQRVVLITHEGCAWYRHISVAGIKVLDLAARQTDDLKKIKVGIRKEFPNLQVVSYFAKPQLGHVSFTEID